MVGVTPLLLWIHEVYVLSKLRAMRDRGMNDVARREAATTTRKITPKSLILKALPDEGVKSRVNVDTKCLRTIIDLFADLVRGSCPLESLARAEARILRHSCDSLMPIAPHISTDAHVIHLPPYSQSYSFHHKHPN